MMISPTFQIKTNKTERKNIVIEEIEGNEYIAEDPVFKLLIITPEEFNEEADRLRRFKSLTNRPTIVLTLEYIYSNFAGDDKAEQIKNAIVNYEKINGIEYVLLFGDCDKIPVRYVNKRTINSTAGTVGVMLGNTSLEGVEFLPTDLYYADLYQSDGSTFCSWDSDEDGLYDEKLYDFAGGEWYEPTLNIDDVDVTPDVAVGRIPASSLLHAENYVDKVIEYELNAPGKYPNDWFNTALFISGKGSDMWNPTAEITQLNESAEILSDLGFETIKIYNDSCGGDIELSVSNINDKLTEGAGFVNLHSHGNRNGWGGTYTWNDLNYDNDDKLPIMFAMSCLTAAYAPIPHRDENYTSLLNLTSKFDYTWPVPVSSFVEPEKPNPIQNTTVNPSAIVEYLLVRNLDGVIAYIGATDVSLAGATEVLNDGFFQGYDEIINKRAANIRDTNGVFGLLGDVWNSAINYYCNQCNIEELPHRNKLIRFNLFGDPSLYIGGLPFQDWIVGEDILHWNGSLWIRHNGSLPSSKRLNSVQMINPMNGWAVGEMGTIMHWNGHIWTNTTSPTTEDLYSLDFLCSNDGWAVGAHGTILHFDGVSWNNYSSPTNLGLQCVDILNPWFGIAGGQTILHWDGISWNTEVLYSDPILNSISIVDEDYAWGVGDGGEMTFWDGNNWTLQVQIVDFELYSVDFCIDKNSNILGAAVGDSGTILYYNGSMWLEYSSPTSNDLESVCIVADKTMGVNLANTWTVGESGTIIKGSYAELSGNIGSTWSLVPIYSTNHLYSVDSFSKNIQPVARLDDVSMYIGTTTTPIQFKGINSYDFNNIVLKYHWDFGDGRKSTNKFLGPITYQAGTYTVTLCITDKRLWSITTKAVIITEGVNFPLELFLYFTIILLPIIVYINKKSKQQKLNQYL